MRQREEVEAVLWGERRTTVKLRVAKKVIKNEFMGREYRESTFDRAVLRNARTREIRAIRAKFDAMTAYIRQTNEELAS
jgi:hypothetical protein